MPKPIAPLHLWHLASLDAPTVAVVWALAFAWAAHVGLPAWVPALLALGTFAVYVADRLLDVRSALRRRNLAPLRPRHRFHWRHRRLLAPLAGSAALAAAALIAALMPPPLRERNSVLAAAALVYFSRVHLPRRAAPRFPLISKELLVGLLFAAGCAAPTLLRLPAAQMSALLPAALFFAALAGLNCHAIDRWEAPSPGRILPLAFALAAAGLVLAAIVLPAQPRLAALLFSGALAAALLALLDCLRSRLAPLTLRASADLVLLTPLALLLAA